MTANGIESQVSPSLRRYWRVRHQIPGLLEDLDFLIFDWLLSEQSKVGIEGDLLEIGAFMGRSAIVIGQHAQTDEAFLVCDVFGDLTNDDANDAENRDSYRNLNREAFVANYARFVDRPPKIIQELSANIRQHVAVDSLRFAHIDGGHLYSVVAKDIVNVAALMNRSGIVVCDDFRARHTPGVAAAVWEAVATRSLTPICVTDTKFYGAPNQEIASMFRRKLRAWLTSFPGIAFGEQSILGQELLVVANVRIWTFRRRIRAVLPPFISERVVRIPVAHRGLRRASEHGRKR